MNISVESPDVVLPLGGPSRAWTLALTSVAFFMVALDTLVVVTALPAIGRELGARLSTLQWTINAFTLPYAAGIITAAALGDLLGRRRIFVTGLVVFTIASAACALARSADLLIVARVVQGLGAALVMPLSLTLLTSAFPPEKRGAVIGIWGGLGGLAVASGPLVGGLVTQGLDWHWIFWINVPIGLIAAALAPSRLVESRGPGTRLDLPGALLVSLGAACFVWGLVGAAEAGTSRAASAVALTVSAVAFAAFLLWERRAAHPMVPLRLFRSLSFGGANATAFLMVGTVSAAAFLISQYFQAARGCSPVGAGLRLLPWTATPMAIAPLAGKLSDRLGRRPILVLGTLLQGAGLEWFASLATAQVPYAALVLPLLMSGVGISMALPVAPAAALSAVAPADIGTASGVHSTLQRFGSAFAVAVAAAVFASFGHLGSVPTFIDGFRPALAVAGGFSLLAALAALTVRGPVRPLR